MLKTKRISIENIQKKMRADSDHVTTKKKKKSTKHKGSQYERQ